MQECQRTVPSLHVPDRWTVIAHCLCACMLCMCVVVQAGDDVFVVQMILSIASFDEFKVAHSHITPQRSPHSASCALPLHTRLPHSGCGLLFSASEHDVVREEEAAVRTAQSCVLFVWHFELCPFSSFQPELLLFTVSTCLVCHTTHQHPHPLSLTQTLITSCAFSQNTTQQLYTNSWP